MDKLCSRESIGIYHRLLAISMNLNIIRMDFKKKYIVKCVLSLLALEEDPPELLESDKLDELLASNSCNALLVLYKPGKRLKLIFPEQNFPLDPNILLVTIIKMRSDIELATVSDGFNIALSTADCLRNLSSDISNLYLQAAGENTSLSTLLKSLKSSEELTMELDENELESIEEEFTFWRSAAERASNPEARKKAEYFTECYKQIEDKWLNIDSLDHKDFKELIEITFYNLENVWNSNQFSYSPRRFAKLLKAFTDRLWRHLSMMVPRMTHENKHNLAFVESTIKLWVSTFEEYRTLNWQHKHFPFAERLQSYCEKVEDVKQILVLLEQIAVINREISLELDMREISDIFEDTVPLSMNSVLSRNWQKSKKKFFSVLQSKSLLISLYFKERVISISVAKRRPLRVLQDLMKWSSLLGLPEVQKNLASEKSEIFKLMGKHTQQMKKEFQSRTGQSFDPIPGKETMIRVKNFSPFISAIVWARQVHDKIKRIYSYCEILFKSEADFETFKYESEDTLKEIEAYETEQLEGWKNELSEAEYSDEGLGLQMNGKMMEFDLQNSRLSVNYSEKLILLIRDIRQLSQLGLKKQIPSDLIAVAENGRKFYKEALALKKIANFYNNMGSEIIFSQRGMLLRELQHFQESVESVNKSMGGQITWDDPSSVQAYIKTLNSATNVLLKQNDRLHKLHEEVLELIEQLTNYDLKKCRQTWLLKLEKIKAVVETACKGKEAKYCRKWKVHCDVQLYKVLELQFLSGIEDSESITPDISVQVVLKGKEIAFRPSAEQLREKYYRQIMNYLLWPSRVFKGINGNLELYQKLGERNSHAIKSLIARAQNLFGMLSLHLRSLQQWGVIPYLTVQGINDKIKTMEEWEFNIRVIRMKRKELQKVPDYQRVQSFSINHTKLKNTADELLQDFLEKMMNALKESVISHSEEVSSFLTHSLVKLSKKPSSLEEMQQTKADYLEIKGKQKETKRKIDEIIIKKKWILQATGYQHETEELESQWEEFSEKVQDYDNLLAEQIEHLKGMIDGRISEVVQEIQKYETKTSSIIIPSRRSEIPDLVNFLKESEQQQGQIVQSIQTLRRDCEQFELPLPNIVFQPIDWDSWAVLRDYHEAVIKFQNQLIVKIKSEALYSFQDLCTEWQEKVKKMDKTRQVIHIIKEIDLFKSLFSTLRLLSSGILQKDHWRQFWSLLNCPFQSGQSIRLSSLLNEGKSLVEKLPQVQDIISRAQGEATLAEALKQLAIWWETSEFEMSTYEGKRNKCQLIKQWKQMTSKVSDNMCLVSSLKESRWVGKFQQTIEGYETKIGRVERALYSLNSIQRRWVYLEPILVGGALPQQMERFNKLDLAFRNVMGVLAEKPKLATLADIEGLDSTLETIMEEQQRCQKALNEFLQVKRSKFPRFYFLGDEDLLEILAQTQNPQVIQLHMKKLFAAVHSVGFSADSKQIIEISSIEKQRVNLSTKVALSQNVEDWLNILEKQMFVTLEQLLREYVSSPVKEIKLADYPSQILCLMEKIRFSEDLKTAIENKNLKGLESQLRQQLQSLTKTLPSVARLQSLKLKAIILDLIHHISIVSQLTREEKPVTLNTYSYTKNFQFTPKPDIALFDYRYNYTFEYQGNLPKLVHTPLTDKCYITLSLALSLGLGGNPYGPAGTGKTETVKAMAMLFGRMCLVFNCDEGLDFKSMGRIFLGLVRCGAWGCFDQFNRLLEDQLSAISQQIQIIQFAIKANNPHLELLGKKVDVNPNSGIFVTLNPAGKGYGGRSRLPDNLKQLFRPVAMSVPDNELIAEVLLYSEGFKQAKQLAQKVICLFTLSQQLLSQQQHYDWGLRALKTILSVAGRLIFQERSSKKEQVTFEVECELVIKAIRINTLSKLTFTDMRKFKHLLGDIFPGVESKDISYDLIQSHIPAVLAEMNLSYNDAQVSKVLQFYESTQQRMGVVLVGPSGCGKTTIWKVLRRCFEKMNIPLKTYLMNPKSMSRQQLLGNMNNDTREFSEGVLTVSAREVVKNPGNNWIILDGDIDPEWIESLNSVLDDNHLLTLPTGERINFPSGTCFIFETDSLLYASPATVSRMGMIFLNNEDINIAGLIDKWTDSQPHLKPFFQTLSISSLLGYDENLSSTLIGQVSQVLSQMKGVKTQAQFIAACARGLQANHLNDPSPLIDTLFERFNERNPFSGKQALSFYAEGNVMKSYSTLPEEFDLYEVLSDKGALLQTAKVQAYLAVLQRWVEQNEHFVVVGPEGSGKSMLIKTAYSEIKKTMKINFATISCSSQTNAQHIINKLYQICLKANSGAGKILRPKECARLVLYLKDINLPKPDKYQTIQLASFLQQIISHKGFYDPTTLEFVQLDEKIQIVVSMFPPSSIGRNQLTQRFTAIVKILAIDYPSNEDLGLVYREYFRSLLRDRKIDEGLADKLGAFMIEIYLTIKKNFSADEYRHYTFTPKSLFTIFRRLPNYEFSDKEGLVEVLLNQFLESYCNKLVSSPAKTKFLQLLSTASQSHFRLPLKHHLFSCFSGRYVKVSSEDYAMVMKAALVQYGREYKEIAYVSLEDSIRFVNSTERALQSDRHLMLVGSSGSGRRTTMLLASLIQKSEVVLIPCVRDMSVREFRKEIKSIIEIVVNENKKQILFLEDHNFSKPEFIEMINSLIVSGEIPGLFTLEELDRMPAVEDLRKDSIGITLQEAFCARVNSNLKLVLSFDHQKDGFFQMCASNPALYSCSIIWFDPLPSSSLRSIASEILSRYLPEFSRATVDEISSLASEVHLGMQSSHHISQRYFFTLMETYVNIFQQKSQSKRTEASHLQRGLEKLVEAKQLVDVLSKEAFEQQKLLEIKNAEASKAMGEIQKAMTASAERRAEAEELARDLQKEEKKIMVKKESVQEELSEVQPLIEQAKKSVQGIKSSNLNQLASMANPPKAVVDVMKVLIRLFGETNSDWNTIKTFLKNRSFIDNILNFDPRMINSAIRRDVENEVQKNANSFQKQVIFRASVAAGPLGEWVKATLKYSRVVESIKPLEGELNRLLKDLESSKARVVQCQEEMAVIEKKSRQLKKIYDEKIGETVVLDNQLKKSQATLTTAKSLLSKLEDERIRWQQDFTQIEKEVREYPISSFVASAFSVYLCNRDQSQRESLMAQWKVKARMEKFNFLRFMSNESQQLKWRSQGLGSDSLSVENSVITFCTSRTPLLMDPNSQAIDWLKRNREHMEVTTQRSSKFTNSLQLAVRFGKEILVAEVDEVEPILIPVLRGDTFQQGSRVVIRVGDRVIDFSPNFKLFMATRNSNMHLPANVLSLVSLVNYSVTRSGLESKLLSMVINHEKPELEERKVELLENEERLKSSLTSLEQALLEQLGGSTGNILENAALLDNLTRTKSESVKISHSLRESEDLNAKLDQEREVYKPLAKKGAQIFLLLSDLPHVNNMYRFSLVYFTRLFLSCLDQKDQGKLRLEGGGSKVGKLQAAEALLSKIVYNNIASSLFKADRLSFGLHLLKGIAPDLISQRQWDFFTGVFPIPLQNKVILPNWCSFDRQESFNHFCVALPKIAKSLNFNDASFQEWYRQADPERKYPAVCSGLSGFQKILMLVVFRPDKLQTALIQFVVRELNLSSISGASINFKTISEKQISSQIPALFIVSTGYDPSKELEEFSEGEVGHENYVQLSMGGGQNEVALELMRQAAQKGQWLCLKNVHLVTVWLPTLEKQFRALEGRHANFRLFLTSEQHSNFPNVLLETCYKVSYESPPGMKKNFVRVYTQLEASSHPLKASFIFLLAYFHSLVQERRTYIPQGWSKSYEFSYSDLKVSMEIIGMLIKEYEATNNLNLETLYGIFEEGIYGGRIDNPSDLKVLRAYLRRYFNLLVINGQEEVGFGATIPKNQKELTAFIASMPEIDNPSVFGLPRNIDKVVQKNNSQWTIGCLKRLASFSLNVAQLKREDWIKIATPILTAWDQVYKQVKDAKIPSIKQSQLLAENPVESFIYLEVSQAMELLQSINNSLKSLGKVLDGRGLITTETQTLMGKIVENSLPKQWEDFYSECGEPLDWIRMFGRRIILLKQWITKANNQQLLGEEFDLSELFHPAVFINACKQAASRKKIALDKLSVSATFEQDKASERAIKIKGLLIQGCSMAKHLLGAPSKAEEEFESLPVLYIDFLANPPPLYPNVEEFCWFSSSSRETVLMKLKLGVAGSSADKIIAGTAIMLKDI